MKEKLIETIANELIGYLPTYKGPFVSQAEARRCAAHQNSKRFALAEDIATAIIKLQEEEAKERYEIACVALRDSRMGIMITVEEDKSLRIASGYKPQTK